MILPMLMMAVLAPQAGPIEVTRHASMRLAFDWDGTFVNGKPGAHVTHAEFWFSAPSGDQRLVRIPLEATIGSNEVPLDRALAGIPANDYDLRVRLRGDNGEPSTYSSPLAIRVLSDPTPQQTSLLYRISSDSRDQVKISIVLTSIRSEVTAVASRLQYESNEMSFSALSLGADLPASWHFSFQATSVAGEVDLVVAADPLTPETIATPQDIEVATVTFDRTPGNCSQSVFSFNRARPQTTPGLEAFPSNHFIEYLVSGIPQMESAVTAEDTGPIASPWSGELVVGQTACQAGTTVDVPVYGSVSCETSGLRLAIGHDPQKLQFLGASPSPFLDSLVGNDLVFQATGYPGGYAVISAAFDGAPQQNAQPVVLQAQEHLFDLHYAILPIASPGPTSLLNQSGFYGNPPVVNMYIGAPASHPIRTHLVSGLVDVTTDHSFVRGNVNNRSAGLLDAGDVVDLVEILLGGLTPSYDCAAAADVNNDGRHNIIDVAALVQGLFGTDGFVIPPPRGAPDVTIPDGGSIPSELGCRQGELCSP